MAYVNTNFKTKAELKRAVASHGAQSPVRIMSGVSVVPDPVERPDYTGVAFVEGPHYPRPHTWYAKVQVTDGVVTRVLS